MKLRNKVLDTFKDLEFDEPSHTYTLNGEVLPSVSSLLKHFYEDFDSYNIGLRYADKRGFDPNDVWDAWTGEGDIASNKGHRVHLFGEDYANWRYFGIGEKPKVTCKQTLGIINYYNDYPQGFSPIVLECRMYNEEYGYSGTADILSLYDKDKTIHIHDYKTNNSLIDESKPLLYHIDSSFGLRQDNFGKYALQFSFYQLLLELSGFSVGGRVLVWLSEDKSKNKLYQTFRTPDLTKELIRLKHIWSPKFN